MKKNYKLLFILCCAQLIMTQVVAQDVDNIDSLRGAKAELEAASKFRRELKAEIMAELKTEFKLEEKQIGKEKKKRRAKVGVEAKDAISKVPRFSGYAQIGYIWQDDNGSDISTFKVNRVRLILDGDISKIFDYRIQVEGFSNSLDSNNKAMLSIQDMFIRAKLRPEIALQIGQFPIPLSMENYDISPGTLEPINFSSIVNRMVCRNAVTGVSHYGRDVGVMALGSLFNRGDYNLLSYNVAVFNGSQMNQADDNRLKDIVGRVTVQPLRELKISASFNWGQYTMQNTKNLSANLARYVVGGVYKCESFIVRGEYGYQYSDKASVKEEMYYILAGYNISDKIMPIFRYDVFNDKKIVAGKQNNYLLGVVYSPITRLRVQANYTITKYQRSDFDLGNKLELMVTGFF